MEAEETVNDAAGTEAEAAGGGGGDGKVVSGALNLLFATTNAVEFAFSSSLKLFGPECFVEAPI